MDARGRREAVSGRFRAARVSSAASVAAASLAGRPCTITPPLLDVALQGR
jgi:hypothetical protein